MNSLGQRLVRYLAGLVLLTAAWAVPIASAQPDSPRGGDPPSAAASSNADDTSSDDDALVIVTANVRYGTAKDGDNDWEHRKQTLVRMLRATEADIIGTQEMLPFQAQYIQQQLEQYEYFGQSREPDNSGGEQCGIYVRRDRFVVLGLGHFWLSETPDVPGSIAWDSSLPRMVTWLKLFDRRHQGSLIAVNTHFDHLGGEARRQSAKLLRRQVAQWADQLPILVTGDFNCGEESPPYRELLDQDGADPSPLVDVYRQLHPERQADEGTFNGFHGIRSGPRIDWILVNSRFTPKSAQILNSSEDGRYASDHFFVRAVLDW